MSFQITGINVLLLVALCIPGFLLTKCKLLKEDHIKGFSMLLLYICGPALSIYSFQQAECNAETLQNIGIVILVGVVGQLVVLAIGYIFYHKTFKTNPAARVATVASSFGNVGFFGVPVLQLLLPEHPEIVVYSAVYVVAMNFIGWTLGMFIMSGNKEHISWKNILINPTTVMLCIALPLFFTNTKLPNVLTEYVTFFAKASTPLAMTIIGIRLALASPKEMFDDYKVYLAIVMKLVIFPLLVFLAVWWLPIDQTLKVTIFILCGMPPAAFALNYAELTETSPKTAANIVILGSIACAITLPLLLLLV